MKNPFLVGNRIYLRGLELADLEGKYLSWLNDEEVCQYNSHHFFPYHYDQAAEYVKNVNSSSGNLVLAIVLKEGNIHIGNISLQQINLINRSAEFAILLGEKDYWGMGLAKEAASLLIKHGFKELNLQRIHCGTAVNNTAMKKLALFLGMKEEGIRRQALFKHGQYIDVIEFGLLSSEYVSTQPQKATKKS